MSNFFEDSKKNKIWKNDKGQYHRVDGPTIEFSNGNKFWYINGNLHRLDGPAIEDINLGGLMDNDTD